MAIKRAASRSLSAAERTRDGAARNASANRASRRRIEAESAVRSRNVKASTR